MTAESLGPNTSRLEMLHKHFTYLNSVISCGLRILQYIGKHYCKCFEPGSLNQIADFISG